MIPIQLVIIEEKKEVARKQAIIRDELNRALQSLFDHNEFAGFSTWEFESDNEKTWPLRWKWIAVYPVTGSSEAHWVHVDLILSDAEGNSVHQHMLKTKTFAGWETACRIANATSSIIGA